MNERAGPSSAPDIACSAAFVIDAVAIVGAGYLSGLVYQAGAGIAVDKGAYLGVSLLLAAFFTLIMRGQDGYQLRNLLSLDRQVKAALIAWTGSFGLILGCAFLLKSSSDLSRGASLIYALVGLAAIILHRVALSRGLARALASGAVRRHGAIVLTAGSDHATDAQIAALRLSGVEIAKSFHLHDDPAARAHTMSRLIAASRRAGIREIIVLLSARDLDRLGALVEELRPIPLPVRLMPDGIMSRLALQPRRSVGQFAVIDIAREPLSPGELRLKRAFDVVASACLLLAAAPLIVVAMVAVKLDTPGPVLFRQTRRGFNGRTFKILKLRTMTVQENGSRVLQVTRGDARVTRVGAWLRRTSVDELPQLWNVLRGEMSIVGPRPHAVAHDNYYDQLIENYAFRHHVKPGLTGWAQIHGLRGETPQVAMMAARVDHDVWYINNWSMILDLRILFLTSTRLLARTAY